DFRYSFSLSVFFLLIAQLKFSQKSEIGAEISHFRALSPFGRSKSNFHVFWFDLSFFFTDFTKILLRK
ncbi:hypothetical protein PJP10_31880, partial [Mycobacterium kansasii]